MEEQTQIKVEVKMKGARLAARMFSVGYYPVALVPSDFFGKLSETQTIMLTKAASAKSTCHVSVKNNCKRRVSRIANISESNILSSIKNDIIIQRHSKIDSRHESSSLPLHNSKKYSTTGQLCLPTNEHHVVTNINSPGTLLCSSFSPTGDNTGDNETLTGMSQSLHLTPKYANPTEILSTTTPVVARQPSLNLSGVAALVSSPQKPTSSSSLLWEYIDHSKYFSPVNVSSSDVELLSLAHKSINHTVQSDYETAIGKSSPSSTALTCESSCGQRMFFRQRLMAALVPTVSPPATKLSATAALQPVSRHSLFLPIFPLSSSSSSTTFSLLSSSLSSSSIQNTQQKPYQFHQQYGSLPSMGNSNNIHMTDPLLSQDHHQQQFLNMNDSNHSVNLTRRRAVVKALLCVGLLHKDDMHIATTSSNYPSDKNARTTGGVGEAAIKAEQITSQNTISHHHHYHSNNGTTANSLLIIPNSSNNKRNSNKTADLSLPLSSSSDTADAVRLHTHSPTLAQLEGYWDNWMSAEDWFQRHATDTELDALLRSARRELEAVDIRTDHCKANLRLSLDAYFHNNNDDDNNNVANANNTNRLTKKKNNGNNSNKTKSYSSSAIATKHNYHRVNSSNNNNSSSGNSNDMNVLTRFKTLMREQYDVHIHIYNHPNATNNTGHNNPDHHHHPLNSGSNSSHHQCNTNINNDEREDMANDTMSNIDNTNDVSDISLIENNTNSDNCTITAKTDVKMKVASDSASSRKHKREGKSSSSSSSEGLQVPMTYYKRKKMERLQQQEQQQLQQQQQQV